ncbi:MAG: aspartate--tRNA ligase [Defluviitaleaceae bacterium]|nr:aspartate--tRNA ligase [Defluviitaleaceae bacterium]MCL2238945.1 aspartate--tRNA ligase [Defluviitaleaceae bacterium]
MHTYRTHTCGEATKDYINQTITLSGWVDTIRDHGGVIFIALRDHYGSTQIVFNDDSMLIGINRECVISASGTLRERDSDTVDPKIATGEVELVVASLTILSKANPQLPFEINASTQTREDVRLKYRYLDLRNPKVQHNIVMRSRVTNFLRMKMIDLGFLEIHTPILTASSPEGARDYIVPSRKHHGMFYALPQAPQIFKQLLMVSGFDRYFQIAPCFRDEDARADRSPGEFYQLDFEMAFATQEDVFSVAEQVLHSTFTELSDKKVSPVPFTRIPFDECMLKYGTDKPDLRNPLLINDLTDFFSDVDFVFFKGKPVRGIVAPDCAKLSKTFFEKMLSFATEIGMQGLGYISVLEGMTLKGPIVKFLCVDKQQELINMLGMKENDTLFFICDAPGVVDKLAGGIRTELGKRLRLIDENAFAFCFVTDFPMYEENDAGEIVFTHNPFSMPQGEMDALDGDALDVKAYQYDVICNGVELSSGAVRNHRPDIMVRAFEIAGYTREDIEAQFPALFNAFHYGAPPHAGMAPGLDRIVMLLTGQENIREVIPFPMNASAQDLLLGAPGYVTDKQLKETHIRIR